MNTFGFIRASLLLALGIMGSSALGTVVTFKDGANFSVGANNVVNYQGTQDTIRSSTMPTSNFGAGIDFFIGDDVGNLSNPNYLGKMDGLIRFDITAMAGQWSNINSVTLRLFNYSPAGEVGLFPNTPSRYVDVFQVTGNDVDWIEGTGTFASPGLSGATQQSRQQGVPGKLWTPSLAQLANDVVKPAGVGQYVNFPLTLAPLNSLVGLWESTPTNGGMMLRLDGLPASWDRNFAFGAHDNLNGVELLPELVIDYTAIPEPGVSLTLISVTLMLTRRQRRTNGGKQ